MYIHLFFSLYKQFFLFSIPSYAKSSLYFHPLGACKLPSNRPLWQICYTGLNLETPDAARKPASMQESAVAPAADTEQLQVLGFVGEFMDSPRRAYLPDATFHGCHPHDSQADDGPRASDKRGTVVEGTSPPILIGFRVLTFWYLLEPERPWLQGAARSQDLS